HERFRNPLLLQLSMPHCQHGRVVVLSILVIRKHQRFAVRQAVRLQWDRGRPSPGLLVEVSLDGCRLSIPGSGALATGQAVTLAIDEVTARGAQVRWADNGLVGLRFDQPLHNAELDELLTRCRPQADHCNGLRSYGT
ncbi:MAG: PilZ domain-containing protein, partial [Novosphingobium sp.]